MREVAAIQFELTDFLTANRVTEIRGLRFHLRDFRALNNDFGADGPHLQSHVHAGFLRHRENHVLGLIFFEAGRGYGDVVTANGQGGEQKVPAAIGSGVTGDAVFGIADRHLSSGNGRSAGVGYRACDRGGVLRKRGDAESCLQENSWPQHPIEFHEFSLFRELPQLHKPSIKTYE